jgi:guanylate kinase
MQEYPIIVLVGTSGGGKTALLFEMLKRFPNDCAALKSLTTRTRRGPEDDVFYDFVSRDYFETRYGLGEVFQRADFGGNLYGCERSHVNSIVSHQLGLVVLVQQAIQDFLKAGYTLHLVHIVPEGHQPRNENARLRDDEARARIVVDYDATIVNSFAPGGFQAAADELAAVIESLLSRSLPSASQTPHQPRAVRPDR